MFSTDETRVVGMSDGFPTQVIKDVRESDANIYYCNKYRNNQEHCWDRRVTMRNNEKQTHCFSMMLANSDYFMIITPMNAYPLRAEGKGDSCLITT